MTLYDKKTNANNTLTRPGQDDEAQRQIKAFRHFMTATPSKTCSF